MSYNRYIDIHHAKCVIETDKWDHTTPVSSIEKYEYGLYLFEILDYCYAVHWFHQAVKEKVTEGYYMLAYCLEKGYGISTNHEEAQRLFQLYISEINFQRESGTPLSMLQQYRLAMCLQYSFGTNQDEMLAMDLFVSATKELGEASFEMGIIYRDGRCNLPINKELADQYFIKAYHQLYGDAIFASFELYEGTIENYPFLMELKTGYSYLLGRYMRVAKVNPNYDSLLRLSKFYEKGYPGDTTEGYANFKLKANKYYKEAEKYKKD